ncbi:unnamed protein product [Coregonus sp. 'balchen']|nr:unnamed protein product [Coregonus sp. 'balchen']
MLFNKCGLVALWMVGHLRQPPLSVSMETVVQTAMDRAYTAQGEMFSASDMALLAEEGTLGSGLRLDRSTLTATHMHDPREAYILAKQGKSLRYQLWRLDKVAQSNAQLREIDPQRSWEGTQYVVPKGGVEAGMASQVVLLHTGGQTQ